MILALCAENTVISIGGYEKGTWQFALSLAADTRLTEDQYTAAIGQMLGFYGSTGRKWEGGILSSVVPKLTEVLRGALSRLCKGKVYLVSPGLKTGLSIKSQDPSMFGSDIVCTCAAAVRKYPAPCVVIDMGTATTFSAIDAHVALIGKAIFPGAEISLEALSQRAALLPAAAMGEPGELIATGTMDAMRSGLIYGYASMVDGMSARFCEQLGEGTTLVATGALSKAIVPYCRAKITLDEHLALDGLYHIYCKNAPHSVRG